MELWRHAVREEVWRRAAGVQTWRYGVGALEVRCRRVDVEA